MFRNTNTNTGTNTDTNADKNNNINTISGELIFGMFSYSPFCLFPTVLVPEEERGKEGVSTLKYKKWMHARLKYEM